MVSNNTFNLFIRATVWSHHDTFKSRIIKSSFRTQTFHSRVPLLTKTNLSVSTGQVSLQRPLQNRVGMDPVDNTVGDTVRNTVRDTL